MKQGDRIQQPGPADERASTSAVEPDLWADVCPEDLFEGMFEGVQIIDFQWRYLYLNSTAAEHGRRRREELVGRSMMEMYPGIDQTPLFALMRRSMEERTHQRMVNHFAYPDGSDAWFDLRITAVPQGILVLSIDITEQKNLELQLRHAQKMDAIGSLAGGIAHDFNNLITVIAGYADVLEKLEGSAPRSRRAIDQIRWAAERAGALTRQLLAFSRRQVIDPKVINLNEVLDRVVSMLEPLLGETILITFKPAAELDNVIFDPGQVEQIAMNLAVNARDAMPTGGSLTVETANVDLDEEYCRTHADSAPGPHVMMAVTDTGAGMAEAVRERIFEPFFTTKTLGRGTGLGLSTVFGIVKQGGGNIWVYSEPGRGTTFKVYLPSAVGGTSVAAYPVVDAGVSKGGLETILLVEDETGVRTLFETVLVDAGYTVLSAENAEVALQRCASHDGPIDALLTDVVLPGLGGPELARRVLDMRPEVRVIYTSGYTPNAVVHQGVLDAGAAFLEKPVRPAMLLRKLREFLN